MAELAAEFVGRELFELGGFGADGGEEGGVGEGVEGVQEVL